MNGERSSVMDAGEEWAGTSIGVIGLGYVGLPLAVAFGQQFPTVGFDISVARVCELAEGVDRTREISPDHLKQAPLLHFSSDPAALADCSIYIVAVPTPIDAAQQPDLGPLLSATRQVAQVLKPGDLVIFESTVYPGCTEEDCVPLLEQGSGLSFNRDFCVGYSPERINPGDLEHSLVNTVKVTSGSTPEAARRVDALYRSVVRAGTWPASSIRVAEAAKVIENTQRDLNIALVNELALIFQRMGIDTQEVLAAAGSKWNFLPFKPGLVGGHCIGVDPYYLTHKAQELGYRPEVILAGRRINDAMGRHIAERVVQAMVRRGINPCTARVLQLGVSFKENCADIRNSKAGDILTTLADWQIKAELYDPWVDADEVERAWGVRPLPEWPVGRFDAVIVAVAHDAFKALDDARIQALLCPEYVLFDVKAIWPRAMVTERL